MSVYVSKKIFKNASSRVSRAFKDVKLNEKQPTESYLTEVTVVLFAVVSATSYYRFLGSTPFEITRGIYDQQINYVHAKLQVYLESIWHVWQRVHNKEAWGVIVP